MKNNKVLLLTLTLGSLIFLQVFHVFTGVIIWNLDYYVGGPEFLAIAALGIISLLFLALPLEKLTGPWTLFLIAFTTLGISRILIQVFSHPLVRIIAASAGVIAYLWFLVSWFNREIKGIRTGYLAGFSLTVGSLLDLVIRTWLLGYDMPWRRTTAFLIVSLFIALLLIILTFKVYEIIKDSPRETKKSSPAKLFFLGPWLFLSMTIFHNPPALAGLTGGSDLSAGIISIAVTALFIVPALYLATSENAVTRNIYTLSALLLFYAVVMINLSPASMTIWIISGGAAHMILIGTIFGPPVTLHDTTEKNGKTALSAFLMFFIIIIFIFLYGEFKLREITAAAALLFLPVQIVSFFTSRSRNAEPDKKAAGLIKILTGIALTVLVSTLFLPLRYKSPPATVDFPKNLKIMTYNIHQSFDAEYVVNLEKIVKVIKGHNADIICLQEVNRGQVVTGMIDSLALIKEKLNYHLAFGSNHADGQYGNAVLSRYPITKIKNHTFKNNIYETRGVLQTEISCNGTPLSIFVTHLDFLPDGAIRALQVKEILSLWGEKPHTIICGDFNAEPKSRELQPMYTAGLKEASRETRKEESFTFHKSRDEKPAHIDYFYFTDDLLLEAFTIDETRASDHKPLVMDFSLKND